MKAICFNCGTLKERPFQPCPSCREVPTTDNDIAVSAPLTDQTMSPAQMQETAASVRARGRSVQLDEARIAVSHFASDGQIGVRRGAPPWVLVLVLLFVVTGSALTFLLYSPGTRYQWAAMQDTVEAYEDYIGKFEGTPEAKKAYLRLWELQEDEVWAKAAAGGTMPELQHYLRMYPDGNHVAEAQAKVSKLMEDWEWVKKQDRVEYYRAFSAKSPSHREAGWLEKRIIDLEVAAIAAGDFGEMPKAEAVRTGGSLVNLEVKNDTGSVLTVLYSGAESKRLVVPPGETGTATLAPGSYHVGAVVSDGSARAFYGTDAMQGGEYSSRFYITKGHGGSAAPFQWPNFEPNKKKG